MKLLIGTPAFGGMISAQYLCSMITTVKGLIQSGVDFSVHTITNESLINRARNSIANFAVENGFDRLLFIDADIGWCWEDVLRVLNCDKPVIGGLYPLKSLPINYNFNPLPQHLDVFAATLDDGTKIYRKGIDQLKIYRDKYSENEKHEAQIMHIPTGFMSIYTEVFTKLMPHVKTYTHINHATGKASRMYEFFPVGVKNDILESEDWAFCSICRENNIPVYVQADVLLSHTGTFTFAP